jgi:biopolymer transport protein ExbB/TolQ
MNIVAFSPIFAEFGGALGYAIRQATTEGKITIGALVIVSIFSWTVIITKGRQLLRANKMGKRFFAAYRESKDPLALARKGGEFDGAPAFELYATGTDEINYHLEHNAITVRGQKRVSSGAFDTVRVAVERAASVQALALEKGMIILSTAVAGGPFIGLLGTVWGVMETFSGIGKSSSATLQVMAPGVAGALIATVVGLFVAIPAMFGYNYMVTTIRAITQELDAFASEFTTQLEHQYVDNRPLSEEIREALQGVSNQAAVAAVGVTRPPAIPPRVPAVA